VLLLRSTQQQIRAISTLIADKRPIWWLTLQSPQFTLERETTGMERINYCNLLYSKDFEAARGFRAKIFDG